MTFSRCDLWIRFDIAAIATQHFSAQALSTRFGLVISKRRSKSPAPKIEFLNNGSKWPTLVAQCRAIGVSVAATPPCSAIRLCKELSLRHIDRQVASLERDIGLFLRGLEGCSATPPKLREFQQDTKEYLNQRGT